MKGSKTFDVDFIEENIWEGMEEEVVQGNISDLEKELKVIELRPCGLCKHYESEYTACLNEYNLFRYNKKYKVKATILETDEHYSCKNYKRRIT